MPFSRCEPPVPPKIRIPQSGPLAFMYVLSEFDSLGLENEGLRLWQALRRVRDWHESPPEEPDAAIHACADVDPALRPSLAALERLLRDPEPDDDTLEAVAFCCFNAAMWADERGAYRTAVGLLHAAEDIYPDNPHYAYNLGRIARKLAFYDESEAWLKWAHYVARSSGKWEVATLALSGLGNLHRQRGNLPKARRLHEVARRLARLKVLRTLEGDALYDLAIMSFDFGDADRGMEYVRDAVETYGPGHGQIYHLANDVAWHWMDTLGDFQHAADVFAILLQHVWEPSARLLVMANLARAAAGAGWKDVFEAVWIDAWTLLRQQLTQDGHAAALLQLAMGAANLGDWERARAAALDGLAVARSRKEAEMVLRHEAVLEAIQSEVIVDETVHRVFKDSIRVASMVEPEEAMNLVAHLSSAMKARSDGAPESPTRALIRRI